MMPNIIVIAVKIITCMINELLTVEILCEGSIDKNSKIVMSPRGAINNKGLKAKPDNFNCTALNIKINSQSICRLSVPIAKEVILMATLA